MKHIWRTSILCALMLLMMGVSLGFATPKMEPIDASTFSFGEVMEGEDVTHVFRFKNTGDDTLEIFNVKGS